MLGRLARLGGSGRACSATERRVGWPGCRSQHCRLWDVDGIAAARTRMSRLTVARGLGSCSDGEAGGGSGRAAGVDAEPARITGGGFGARAGVGGLLGRSTASGGGLAVGMEGRGMFGSGGRGLPGAVDRHGAGLDVWAVSRGEASGRAVRVC